MGKKDLERMMLSAISLSQSTASPRGAPSELPPSCGGTAKPAKRH